MAPGLLQFNQGEQWRCYGISIPFAVKLGTRRAVFVPLNNLTVFAITMIGYATS
jgi:hypothetical protein